MYCVEHTGRYLVVALMLSTITMLSQTTFQLYGIFVAGASNSTLAQCEIFSVSET